MEYLLTGSEMAECDRRTSEVIGIPSLVLMERAALSVADGVDAFFKTRTYRKPVILAAAGRGNNGADALAAGRILLDRGYDVRFCRLSGEVSPGSSFAVQEKILGQYGVKVEIFSGRGLFSGTIPDLIIDGLFGTGLSRDLKGEAADCVESINLCRSKYGTYVVAVDIPSGISSDDGKIMGCAVQCDETRTFAFYKRGHFLYPGSSHAGTIHLAQIGISARSFAARPGMFTFLSERPADLLPGRDPGGNKGTFGKVLIIAGRRNMCGAAILAARACMAAGAGMVKVFTQEANRTILQETVPEALLDTYDDDYGLSEETVLRLQRSMDWADVVAAGPAMGTDQTAALLLQAVLKYSSSPDCPLRGLVLDADALRILAEDDSIKEALRKRREDLPCVLTPHMGEFAALAGQSVRACVDQRVSLVENMAGDLRCTIACKDARTLVASWKAPSGSYLNCSGNSGMASAGSGDVLTGMTAAFLALFSLADIPEAAAPGRSVRSGSGSVCRKTASFFREDIETGFAAACCAVYLHGRAGDLARSLHGENGMTAGDLISSIRSSSFWD